MGCVSSKVDNEEIVWRCKERRRLMKEAVNWRHHFAASHSAYIVALKNTGIALRAFAEGESMEVRGGNVVAPPTPAATVASESLSRRHHHMKFHPPPPPPAHEVLQETSPSASSRMQNTVSSSEYGSPPRPPPPPPPPPMRAEDGISDDFWEYSQTYSDSTPSYQGSLWDNKPWEPFYHSSSPQIPGHEYKKSKQEPDRMSEDRTTECIDDVSSSDFEEEEKGGPLDGMERENRTTAAAAAAPEAPSEGKSKFSEAEYVDDMSSVSSWYTKDTLMQKQMIVARRPKDFAEIARDLEEHFVKANAAGKEVSRILETRRAQNEFETKKNLYHSSNVFDSLPWTWSSKPPLAIRYSLEPSIFDTSGTHGSHCSTLERLLAWEKKLYHEVKNGEARKIEQERKLALLQNQEVRGENVIKIDKTKASIKRLQSLIIVANQAINTTSTAIVELRESELYLQLAELSGGLMQMWRSMNKCHEVQNRVVQQVKNLETMASREATSDNHRQATLQLEAEVRKWYNSFCSLIKSQREYIRALLGWVRLSLRQVGDEVEREQGSRPSIYTLCEEWQQALEKLPDKVASEAIKGFMSVVHAIVVQQDVEQKHKKKTESLSKELQKKMTALRNIEQKYYSSFSLPTKRGVTSDSGYEMEMIDPLAEKRSEIDSYRRRVEDEKTNYSKSIQLTRAMTLNNIQTGLPGVFQATAGFSSVCMHSFEAVYNHTKSLNAHSSVRC